MSHTSKISAITIVDIHALRAACRELKEKQGVNLSIEENVTPRAYFSDQQGMGVAPYVIKLHDCRYDVGLYQTADKRGYEARADLFAGYIAGQLGETARQGEDRDMAQMGKLFKLYAVHATMRTAVAQGHVPQRIDKSNGDIQVVLNLAA